MGGRGLLFLAMWFLFLIFPGVSELPGDRVILYLRRKIIKTFNLTWLDSGH